MIIITFIRSIFLALPLSLFLLSFFPVDSLSFLTAPTLYNSNEMRERFKCVCVKLRYYIKRSSHSTRTVDAEPSPRNWMKHVRIRLCVPSKCWKWLPTSDIRSKVHKHTHMIRRITRIFFLACHLRIWHAKACHQHPLYLQWLVHLQCMNFRHPLSCARLYIDPDQALKCMKMPSLFVWNMLTTCTVYDYTC